MDSMKVCPEHHRVARSCGQPESFPEPCGGLGHPGQPAAQWRFFREVSAVRKQLATAKGLICMPRLTVAEELPTTQIGDSARVTNALSCRM